MYVFGLWFNGLCLFWVLLFDKLLEKNEIIDSLEFF